MSKQVSKTKKVTIEIPKDDTNEDDYVVVYVNGKRIQIKKDEEVEVDGIVKDILSESKRLARRGNKKERIILDEE